jgi:hypothetical protein
LNEEAGEAATSRPQKSPLTVVAGFAKEMEKTKIVLRSSGLGPASRKLATTDVNSVFRLGAELEGPGHQLRKS